MENDIVQFLGFSGDKGGGPSPKNPEKSLRAKKYIKNSNPVSKKKQKKRKKMYSYENKNKCDK